MSQQAQEPPSGSLIDTVKAIPDTPFTFMLCTAAIVISIQGWSESGMDALVLDRRAFWSEPWRLISAHFLHANFLHLFFNLSWTWFMGRELERRLGSTFFFAATLFILLGTSAAEHAFDRGAIGLSGLVYGMWTWLFIGQRRCELLRGVLTKQNNQLMVVWFFFCIVATVTGMLPISNWGHGAGAALGALVGLGIDARGGLRWKLGVPIGASALALVACGATVWWPAWNFGAASIELEAEAWAAMKRDDWKSAETSLRMALRCDDGNGRLWWNLGSTLGNQGREDESIAACYRSFQCGDLDAASVESVHTRLKWLRDKQLRADDERAAFETAKQVVEVAPDDKASWRKLSGLAGKLGDKLWIERATPELERLDKAR